MQLSTKVIIQLFTALSDLKGRPTVITDARGQKTAVHEPYSVGPKFTWNAAKNRNILRREVEKHDEAVMDLRAGLNKLKRELATSTDDPKENMRKLQEKTDAVNEEMRKLANDEIEIDGLLWMPASGLNIKTSGLPPTLIEELMPLIEGEPDFEEDKKPAGK